jgi:hypothetical protein
MFWRGVMVETATMRDRAVVAKVIPLGLALGFVSWISLVDAP